MTSTLIIGASSSIAQALVHRLMSDSEEQLIAITRQPENLNVPNRKSLSIVQSDYNEASIQTITEQLLKQGTVIKRVFICNGLLHQGTLQPEKRLEDVTPDHLQQVLAANTLVPMMWIKHLKRLLKGQNPCVITVFSARIGSITDNRLGGWYSYRASKAALNMLVKTAAVEYARVAKNTRFLVFHPGTTDTPLSKPFQASVPQGKLFTPAFVAERVLHVLQQLDVGAGIDYRDWDNQPIPW